MAKQIDKPFVRRFYSDFEKAQIGAGLLFTSNIVKEPVYIFKCEYGLYGTKREEFSLRLRSEGARIDSKAIVAII